MSTATPARVRVGFLADNGYVAGGRTVMSVVANLLDWFTGTRAYRRLDRPVRCSRCDAPLGYVVLHGHKRWLCAAHSSTGRVEAM